MTASTLPESSSCGSRWVLHNDTQWLRGVIGGGHSLELTRRTDGVDTSWSGPISDAITRLSASTGLFPDGVLYPGVEPTLEVRPSTVGKPGHVTFYGQMTGPSFGLDLTAHLVDELVNLPGLAGCDVPKQDILLAALKTQDIVTSALNTTFERGFPAGADEFRARADEFVDKAAHSLLASTEGCLRGRLGDLASKTGQKLLMGWHFAVAWTGWMGPVYWDYFRFQGGGPTVTVSYDPPADWRNTAYMTDCDGEAAAPFKVKPQDGAATAPGDSQHDRYELQIEATATGDLTGDQRPETAVLLRCSPQPSNFSVEEVQIFTGGPSQRIAVLPTLKSLDGFPLPPIYHPDRRFEIADGRLRTAMAFYTCADSHAGGPSVSADVSWVWDGGHFVAHGQPTGRSKADCTPTAGGGTTNGGAGGTTNGGAGGTTNGGAGGDTSGGLVDDTVSGDMSGSGKVALQDSIHEVLQDMADNDPRYSTYGLVVEPVHCKDRIVGGRTVCMITIRRDPDISVPMQWVVAVDGSHWQLIGIPGATPGVNIPEGLDQNP